MLKVAQTAVNELRGPLRRVRREIVFFDKQHRQATSDRVTRDACAVDAASNDQQVDLANGMLQVSKAVR